MENIHLVVLAGVVVSCLDWFKKRVISVLADDAEDQVGYQLQSLSFAFPAQPSPCGHIFYMVAGIHQSEPPNRTRKQLHGHL